MTRDQLIEMIDRQLIAHENMLPDSLSGEEQNNAVAYARAVANNVATALYVQELPEPTTEELEARRRTRLAHENRLREELEAGLRGSEAERAVYNAKLVRARLLGIACNCREHDPDYAGPCPVHG